MDRVTRPIIQYISELVCNKECLENLNDESILVIYDDDFEGWYTDVRRPYYRLRGKKVTEEQAFDIISRTDRILDNIIEKNNIFKHIYVDKTIYTYDLQNRWFIKNIFPRFCGWCRPDGTIGTNYITCKYPELNMVLEQLYNLIKAFPYLDFVWAITNWNEVPDRCWQNLDDDWEDEDFPDFSDNIDIAFYVHDKTVEILKGKNAKDKYLEYNEKYGADEEKFVGAYYENLGKSPADLDYLKRCLEVHNIKFDEVGFAMKIIDR